MNPNVVDLTELQQSISANNEPMMLLTKCIHSADKVPAFWIFQAPQGYVT